MIQVVLGKSWSSIQLWLCRFEGGPRVAEQRLRGAWVVASAFKPILFAVRWLSWLLDGLICAEFLYLRLQLPSA